MFKGKRILITGGARGIGRSATELLLAEGAKVMALSSNPEVLAKASKVLASKGDFSTAHADLASPDCGPIALEAIQKKWGAFDILINNAAINLNKGGLITEPADFLERTLNINVLGPHRLIKSLHVLLEKGSDPRILNVSSESGQTSNLHGKGGDPAYALSKYALNGLTRQWAGALEGKVAVNCMHPGWVLSDMAPDAPSQTVEGGKRILQALRKPWAETGKFWFGDEEMGW